MEREREREWILLWKEETLPVTSLGEGYVKSRLGC